MIQRQLLEPQRTQRPQRKTAQSSFPLRLLCDLRALCGKKQLQLLLLSLSVRAEAQDSTRQQHGPPVRRISTASAVSQQLIGSITGVRELPDGRVLLNDGQSRRLLLLDTMLVTQRVVLDSMSENESTYGNQQGGLIPYRGDSTIFVDRNSLAMIVLDPEGNISRVRSVPRAQDVYIYGQGNAFGSNVASDAKGRLVYRIHARPAPPVRPPPRGVPFVPDEPDSAFIVALDMDARRLDTLGWIRIPKEEYSVRVNPNGGWSWYNRMNPMPSTDEWAVLPDGSVAFVRGIDYRIDYLNPDGSWRSSPKIAFDWQPMSDSAKRHLVDSVKTRESRQLRNNYTTQVIRWVNTYKRKYPPNFSAPPGYTPPNGFAKDWPMPPGVTFPANYVYACAVGEEPKMLPATGPDTAAQQTPQQMEMQRMMEMFGAPGDRAVRPGGGRPSCIPQPIPNLNQIPNPPTIREVSVISPTELPDFRPPFAQNAVRADMDGNLWIRTTPARPVPGGPVYDIVNREGLLVDRIQIPPGYGLVGFGRGGVVFLSVRGQGGPQLARVRLAPRPQKVQTPR
jgi:hypothetical protein